MFFSIQENASKAFKKAIKKHQENILDYFTHKDSTLDINVLENVDGIESIDSDNTFIILGNKPESLLEYSKNIRINDGHILTLVGESRLMYTSNVARNIAEYLHKQGYLTYEQSLKYFTALQECVLNGIEHGNLGLSQDKKEKLSMNDTIERYHQYIDDHLKNSPLGKKPIILNCEIKDEEITTTVIDNGKGYNVEKVLKNRKKTHTLLHSRGIRLIEGLTDSYEILENGTQIRFSMKAEFLNHHEFHKKSLMDTRKNAKILIVDDQEANTKIAQFYLESVGYQNIYTCHSAAQSIDLATELLPDLILLDIVMPEMNGFTVCRKIKMIEGCQSIPILFFSSLDDTKTRIKSYRLGAVDYVAKPLQKNELVARTDAHIQNGILYRSLNKYVERVNSDMRRAKTVQTELLPSDDKLNSIKERYDIDINVFYKTCHELAGDYWTVEDLGEGKLAIIMADFTGHGVAASLNTVRLHAFIQEFYQYLAQDIETFVKRINDRLKETIPLEDFATFACAILDTTKNELHYVGCGHPPIAIIPYEERKSCKYYKCEGLPLGIQESDKLQYCKNHFSLEVGDSLLFFSDALIEAKHSNNNKMWGEKLFLKKLNGIKDQYTDPDLKDILETFNETAIQPLEDDLTMLYIRFKKKEINKEPLQSYMHPDALLSKLPE